MGNTSPKRPQIFHTKTSWSKIRSWIVREEREKLHNELKRGLQIHKEMPNGVSPLFYALSQGKISIMIQLWEWDLFEKRSPCHRVLHRKHFWRETNSAIRLLEKTGDVIRMMNSVDDYQLMLLLSCLTVTQRDTAIKALLLQLTLTKEKRYCHQLAMLLEVKLGGIACLADEIVAAIFPELIATSDMACNFTLAVLKNFQDNYQRTLFLRGLMRIGINIKDIIYLWLDIPQCVIKLIPSNYWFDHNIVLQLIQAGSEKVVKKLACRLPEAQCDNLLQNDIPQYLLMTTNDDIIKYGNTFIQRKQLARIPLRLMHRCRVVIRNKLQRNVCWAAERLDLPYIVKEYIKLVPSDTCSDLYQYDILR